MIDQLQETVTSLFLAVLKVSADHQGTFRLIVTANVDGEEKPLLVVGNAHRHVEDGHVIGVLNPVEEIVQSTKVAAGVTYTGDLLKEIVAGKCDAMVELWIDAYKNDKVARISSYISRNRQPAKFKVR